MATQSSIWNSDCAVLDVGCYLKYWSTTLWVNADAHPDVISGKFSDGTYCYTVSNGIITAKNACTVEVYLNICSDTQADGSGYVSVRLQAQDTSNYSTGNLITLNTSVTVGFTIYGADSGVITDSITITSGNSNSGSPVGFGPGFGVGEFVSTIAINSVSPGNSGNQNYNAGSTNVGAC